MAEAEIHGADDFCFHLLILGHEIAHLANRHLHGDPASDTDALATEYWADFYGAKVMMTLIGHGPQVHEMARGFFPQAAGLFEQAESIGRASAKLVRTVYQDHRGIQRRR